MPVLAVYATNNARGLENLAHGISTRRWGFPKNAESYNHVEPRTLVLIGTGYSHQTEGGSPRKQAGAYVEGSLSRIMVFRAESRIGFDPTPHWPDELAENAVKYPYRMTLTPLYEIHDVALIHVPFELADAFRLSALTQGAGKSVVDSPFSMAIEQGQLPAETLLRLDEWPEDLAGVGAFFARAESAWIENLRAAAIAHEEVAQWRPISATAPPLPIGPGEPYLFAGASTNSPPDRQVLGAGIFSGVSRMLLSEVWEWFGQDCGADTHSHLREQYSQRVGHLLDASSDPEVEAVLIRKARFFSTAEQSTVPVAESEFVLAGGIAYSLGNLDSDHPILRAVITYFHPGEDESGDEVTQVVLSSIRAQAQLVTPRLGQGAFRAMVSEAYQHRCALTGERVRPVLEAAHIKSHAAGGQMRLDNGLLLRSDMHTLYDRGFISFDGRLSLIVSPQLREKFGNGEWLYARAGSPIAVPAKTVDRPNAEFLEWHRDSVFLA